MTDSSYRNLQAKPPRKRGFCIAIFSSSRCASLTCILAILRSDCFRVSFIAMKPQNQVRAWVAASIFILIVLAGMVFILRSNSGSTVGEENPVATSTTAGTTSYSTKNISTSVGQLGVTGSGNYKVVVDQVPTTNKLIAPDYKASIAYSASINVDARTAIESQFMQTKSAIAKDLLDFDAWIRLGSLHKMGGDYGGAAKIWEYASLRWPTNVVSFANLGDLYQNFIHDYVKAESNWLQEVKNNAPYADAYRNLFTLYTTTTYHSSATAAEDILKKGIAASPKSVDLQVLLARYYKSLGRTADAKAMYEVSIQNAQSQGQTTLASSIQQEAN